MPFTRLRQSLIQPNGSITGSLLGTASYAITSSYAMNGGSGGGSTPVVSVASLNNQTILYNFSSSQEATITGLTLTNNNWGINVVEEWNSGSVVVDQYYNSCSLLMHFSGSNGSTTFIDNSPRTKTFTVNGNSQISTAQSKFGSSSLLLDGTGDYLSSPSNADYAFGTGDFTIECWAYRSTGNDNGILQISSTAGGLQANATTNLAIASWNSARLFIQANNAEYISTAFTNTVNTWNHYALVRSSGVTKLYFNGNLVTDIGTSGAITDTTNYTGTYLVIGGYYSTSYLWNGYIDEVRVTKGVARYTGSFSVPTSEFPTTITQLQTKYIGLMGGLNDTNVDYGVEKLSDSSLKIKKLTDTQQPSGSFLSSSVDRVYVNVLNYSNISVGSTLLGQAFTAVGSTSSYALSRSVVNPYEIVVAVDGAVQSFNNAYSVTSSTINFTENIPSGSLVDIRYLTTPNVNSASYAATSSYSLSGGTTSGKSIALSFILG